MTQVDDDLQAAFAGESQANRKYLAFAKQADKDGYPQIAKVFRAAAAAETVHAHNHLRAMKAIGSTAENIQHAIKGEHYEFTDMYPDFLKHARAEGHKAAARSFDYANQVEKVHHELYSKALKAAQEEKDLEAVEIHVCEICGYTHEGAPPATCPVCSAKKNKFTRID